MKTLLDSILKIDRPGMAAAVALGLGALCTVSVDARPPQVSPPDANGFRWATVGNPGNRLPTPEEAPRMYSPFGGLFAGSVNYEYRIATTEVTATQWAEFATAFAPYFNGPATHVALTYATIYPVYVGDRLTYRPIPGREQAAQTTSFNYAARFVNWLHNDKRSDRAAFETGVYDLRNFGTDWFDGPWSPIPLRNPDAKVWIPSIDELVKSFFYDPDRYGQDQGGYWTYPNGTNSQLTPGWPGSGAQTSAGIPRPPTIDEEVYLPVGSYPNVLTPYGLLDASGSVSEITDTVSIDPSQRDTLIMGTATYGLLQADQLGWIGAAPGRIANGGFRVAGIVPAPGTAAFFTWSVLVLSIRRRR
jgi:hypothetical protein